jgi:hypothetical protein
MKCRRDGAEKLGTITARMLRPSRDRRWAGQVVTWTIQNAAFVRTNNFGVTGNDWQIRGTGEFDLL